VPNKTHEQHELFTHIRIWRRVFMRKKVSYRAVWMFVKNDSILDFFASATPQFGTNCVRPDAEHHLLLEILIGKYGAGETIRADKRAARCYFSYT